MMGRNKIYKDGKERIGVDLQPEEFEEFEKVRWREHKDKTELARIAILEYIEKHADGNPQYDLDKWQQDPDFQAVPAFLSNRDKWMQHYKDSNEQDRTKLRIQALDLSNIFKHVDINENRK